MQIVLELIDVEMHRMPTGGFDGRATLGGLPNACYNQRTEQPSGLRSEFTFRQIDEQDLSAGEDFTDLETWRGLSDDSQYAVIADGTGGPITAIVEELAFSGGDAAFIYEGFARYATRFGTIIHNR